VNYHRGVRTHVVLSEPSPPVKVYPFRVELAIDEGGDLMFVATVEAVDRDTAVKLGGLRLHEVIKEGHFITHFHVSRVDDEELLPMQRQEAAKSTLQVGALSSVPKLQGGSLIQLQNSDRLIADLCTTSH
jgi:hypothetical protein